MLWAALAPTAEEDGTIGAHEREELFLVGAYEGDALGRTGVLVPWQQRERKHPPIQHLGLWKQDGFDVTRELRRKRNVRR